MFTYLVVILSVVSVCLSVCLSVCPQMRSMWPPSMMHWISSYKDPQPYPRTWDLTVQRAPWAQIWSPWTCSTWTSLYRGPPLRRTCSNLFIMKLVRLASGRFASYRNAFLLLQLSMRAILTWSSVWSTFGPTATATISVPMFFSCWALGRVNCLSVFDGPSVIRIAFFTALLRP